MLFSYTSIKMIHSYAKHSGIYSNRHLRNVFIEDLVFLDDDPEPSA